MSSLLLPSSDAPAFAALQRSYDWQRGKSKGAKSKDGDAAAELDEEKRREALERQRKQRTSGL